MPTAPRPGLTLRQGAEAYAPERLVPSVTSNPARLLRLAREGRLAPGTDADVVLLDREHRIRHVMADGVWRVVLPVVRRRG
jgi:beta-aspartyl-dipeptidase (metallo-type)